MTTRPDRLVIVFADALRSRPAAASYQTLIEVSPGRDVESLEPIDAQQLATLLPLFNAGVVAERDTSQSELASLRVDYESKLAELEQSVLNVERLTSQIGYLQSKLDEIKNPPKQTEVTPAQIRVWLVTNFGKDILTQIESMIIAIEDDAVREVARIKWEYGISVLRSDPLLTQFGKALGLSDEQIDAAFLEASKL